MRNEHKELLERLDLKIDDVIKLHYKDTAYVMCVVEKDNEAVELQGLYLKAQIEVLESNEVEFKLLYRASEDKSLDDLKIFLQKNFPNYQAFNSRNVVGDEVALVYSKNGIEVWHCDDYGYIEIIGLRKCEFVSLIDHNDGYSHLKTFEIEVNSDEEKD
jgi:hypothetical protein